MLREGCPVTGEKKLTRRGAVFIILACAVILAVVVLLCSEPEGSGLDSTEARVEYLAGLGWEVDAGSETARTVTLPDEVSGVIAQYNALQKQQGFDLEPYAGKEIESYTYELMNYPNGEEGVVAQLFVYKGRAIAGDIHSSALGGFMHSIKNV